MPGTTPTGTPTGGAVAAAPADAVAPTDPSTTTTPSTPARGTAAALLRRTRESRLGPWVVLVLTAALVWAGAQALRPAPQASAAASGVTAVTLTSRLGAPPVVGRPAPDFVATASDGTSVSLASLRGRPVWLTFGASWCAACRTEAADIQAAYEKAAPSGAVVVQVFLDETATDVSGYAGRVGLTYVTVPDPDTRIASQYRVLGIPAQYFIDRSGVLRAVKQGSLSPDRMDAALAEVAR